MHRSLCSCLAVLAFVQGAGRTGQFSSEDVREDLDCLYETLQLSAYDLFAHTSKEAYDDAYEELRDSIDGSMELLDVWRVLQPFTALAGAAHCNIGAPFSSAYATFVRGGGAVAPFDVTFVEERTLVRHSYADRSEVAAGDRILAIDGESVDAAMAGLSRFLSGESEAMKRTSIELMAFPRVHWLAHGPRASYTLSIAKPDGTVRDVQLAAIPAAAFEQALAAQPPVMRSGREFRFLDAIAYLRPGAFLNDAAGGIADHAALEKTGFLAFLASSYREIRARRPASLIVDLRGNPGGDNSFSDPMIAGFADRPFRFCSRFEVRTSPTTKEFWTTIEDPKLATLREGILTHADGERFAVELPLVEPVPVEERFTGKVYALVDRFTFSNATVTAAILQDYGFGMVIGEPTADTPTTQGAAQQFTLPHSGLTVTYPKALLVRPNGDPDYRGLRPDVVVSDDPFTDGDEILERALVQARR